MVADAFEDSADELGLSGLQADTEEHAGGCGILEGTAVAVEPGSEEDAAGAGRGLGHRLGHVIVQAAGDSFPAFGDVFLLQINADFVQSQMIPHPFQTFSGGFHFSEVIVASALGADDGRDHGGYVYELAVGDGADPAGGSAVNMGVTYGGTAGAYANEGSVPPPPKTGVPGASPSSAAAFSVRDPA